MTRWGCSDCRWRQLVESGGREWRRWCCCCCFCFWYHPSQSTVQQLNNVGDNELEYAFITLFIVVIFMHLDGVNLGCLCCVTNGRGWIWRRWWVALTQYCVIQ